jgi:site-specific DNA-methyltransferase (adenine-specific)
VRPYYERDGITIYHGDCRDVMPSLSGIGSVITDPPYGAGRDFENDAATPVEFLSEVFSMLFLACRDDAFLIHDWSRQRVESIRDFKGMWEFLDLLAVTQENTMAHCRVGYDVFQIKCLYRKGEPKIARRGWNLYKTSRVASAEKFIHPTTKQLDVYKMVVTQFSHDDETILDPFVGSGTTLEAAKAKGRRAIGIEIEERYCEIAAKRLAQRPMFVASPLTPGGRG